MEKLLVICPRDGASPRMDRALQAAVQGVPFEMIVSAEALGDCRNRRILFAVSVWDAGVNLQYYAMLGKIRSTRDCFDGAMGALLVDGSCELYTKAIARELAFAANRAGCAFLGKPLVEATGSLQNFAVQAALRGTDLEGAYHACARELAERLLNFRLVRRTRPQLLVLHASNRKTSNTLALWEQLRPTLAGRMELQEIGLRNGTLADCNGCAYRTCLHFGEQGTCFYGGVIVEEVYPAIRAADGVLFLCPNYNDALAANLTACVNRLTALFRAMPFFEKALFGIVVSGYSGGDLVAEQLISALCMNKAFSLPPRFCLLETANDRGSAARLPGIQDRLAAFGEGILESLTAVP
ncbi:MAG: NAD(P)H-dependent oxidoreductase [Oscillospiraceae bacterium]|nr:NAD(P)H-dependent oxidoreductase [Oscillospiraceae bacterium]